MFHAALKDAVSNDLELNGLDDMAEAADLAAQTLKESDEKTDTRRARQEFELIDPSSLPDPFWFIALVDTNSPQGHQLRYRSQA